MISSSSRLPDNLGLLKLMILHNLVPIMWNNLLVFSGQKPPQIRLPSCQQEHERLGCRSPSPVSRSWVSRVRNESRPESQVGGSDEWQGNWEVLSEAGVWHPGRSLLAGWVFVETKGTVLGWGGDNLNEPNAIHLFKKLVVYMWFWNSQFGSASLRQIKPFFRGQGYS